MKTVNIILALVASGNILMAQDTIYTKGGKVIPAKVYEVTQNEIRYQKASNLEGPVYTIDKNAVSLIEYKNGTKDVFSGNSNGGSYGNPNNSNTYDKDAGYYGDDVYTQGQVPPQDYNTNVYNNYNNYSNAYSGYGGYPNYYTTYNPGVSMNFMFGMPSLLWGVPCYAGVWGGWPYYRSYYRPYWAYNYYRPWGWNSYYGWRGGYYGNNWGWRGGYRGGYYSHGGYGGVYHGPRGNFGGYHGGPRGGGYIGGHGGGGFHGGGFGGVHGGGGGFHGGGGHGGGGHGGHH